MRTDDGARYFGPFTNSGAIRRTLLLVRRQFNLRGCRPLTPNETDYKHCLYGNLKFCTAPCVGNVTREQYLQQVNAACDFLSGQCDEMADQLEAEMRKAATALDFEQAAQFRDAISDLRQATKKSREFVRTPYTLPLAIDPERDLTELGRVLGLPAPPERIEGFDISNISGTFAVASLVSFRHGRPDRANYRRFKMKTVSGQDDFACVAEAVRRRYSRLLRETKASSLDSPAAAQPGVNSSEADEEDTKPIVEELRTLMKNPSAAPRDAGPAPNLPDLILIDGGKGQLNAACAELAKLGLERIPVIGLAKEFEEIYRPGKPAPLRLSHDTGALKLLQRLRDECHRVANTYNAQLRLKKISESILDEFPGIGDARKAALLKKFGSIQRLRLATVEQIAAVSGFGGKAAAELKTFLEARTTLVERTDVTKSPATE